MSFSLGTAKLILDVDTHELLEKEAVAWKATRRGAEAVTAFLAEEAKVRVSDVKKAASIIIADRKAADKAEIDAAKKALAERKAVAKAYFDYAKKLYAEELAEAKKLEAEKVKAAKAAEAERKRVAAEAEKFRREKARAIISEEKRIEKERVEIVKRGIAEEAKLRKAREIEEKKAAESKKSSGLAALLPTTKGALAGVATLVGLGAIASGTLLLRETILGLVSATLKQEEAQRALNAAFGKTSGVYKDLAAQYSKQFSLVNSDVEKSITAFGTLSRQSNLTSTEIKALIPIAIDLQAAYGGSLEEAMRSTQAAILGETEALEKYRIVLQDGVLKTLPQLTEEEKKRFETMSESEKQLIRYRVLLDFAQESQGAATQRAKDAQGGFNDFTNSVDKLAISLGKNLVPALGNTARAFADNISKFQQWIDKKSEYDKAQAELEAEGSLGTLPAGNLGLPFNPNQRQSIRERVTANRFKDLIAQEEKDEQNRQRERTDDLIKEENRRVDIANAAFRRRAEIAVAELKESAKRDIEAIEQRKKFAEAQERIQLSAIEKAHEANMAALEEQEYQRKQASEARLAQIQKDKDAEIKAVEDRRDADIDAIKAAHDNYVKESNERIRQSEITRDALIKDIKVREDNDVRAIENTAKEREKARIIEDREIEDQLEKAERLRESNYKNQLRRFEREGEKLREDYEDRIKDIEEQEEREDERYAKKIRNLEDEAEVQEDINREAIKAIDAQLALLDVQEKAENNRRRTRDLTRNITQAQRDLTNAQGVGSAEEINVARNQLTNAIKLGDPEAVAKAQKDLVDLAGQGAEAIAKAQEKLAELQENLIDENVDQTRDAEKDKLKAAKGKLEEEGRLQKESLDKELKEEQRAEEDRNKRRKKRLADDKNSEKERLDDALKKLELRKEAFEENSEKEKQAIEDTTETAKRNLEDRRRVEDEEYNNNLTRIKNRADAERDAVEAIYNDEVTGIIPAIKRAQVAAKERHDADIEQVQTRYKAERQQIYETYDDPVNGIIAKHKQAEDAAARAYQNTTTAARAAYESQKENIKQFYRNDDGVSGLLDRLDAQKTATEKALAADLAEWEKWKDGVAGPNGVVARTFADAKTLFDQFLNDIKARGGVNIKPNVILPGPGHPDFIGPVDSWHPPMAVPGNPTGGNSATPPLPNTAPPSSSVNIDPNNNYSKVVLGASPNSYWTDKGTHSTPNGGGPAADIFAAMGTPIYAPVDGKVSSFFDRSGGNAAILYGNNGYAYYLAHGNIPFGSGRVNRGDQIGEVGDSGSAKGISHLHFAIATNASVFDRQGGKGDIWGTDDYYSVKARDSGYLFRNPTMYKDMITGERGVLAEKAPERLLGSDATRRFDSGSLSPGMNSVMDYATIGSKLSGMSTDNGSNNGDTLIYNGVAPEGIFRSWNSHKSKRRILRGVKK